MMALDSSSPLTALAFFTLIAISPVASRLLLSDGIKEAARGHWLSGSNIPFIKNFRKGKPATHKTIEKRFRRLVTGLDLFVEELPKPPVIDLTSKGETALTLGAYRSTWVGYRGRPTLIG